MCKGNARPFLFSKGTRGTKGEARVCEPSKGLSLFLLAFSWLFDTMTKDNAMCDPFSQPPFFPHLCFLFEITVNVYSLLVSE